MSVTVILIIVDILGTVPKNMVKRQRPEDQKKI